MTIAGSDLKFIASERMTDSLAAVNGGGGPMGAVILDGTENQVLPDIMPSERAAGATTYRKVFLAALSNNNDILVNAMSSVLARPTDANVSVAMVGGKDTPEDSVREAYWSQIVDGAPLFMNPNVIQGPALGTCNTTAGSADITSVYSYATSTFTTADLEVGKRVFVTGGLIGSVWRTVTAIAGGTVTLDSQVPFTGSGMEIHAGVAPTTGLRVSGAAALTAGASAAATTVTVNTLTVRVATYADNADINYAGGLGRQALFADGETVLIFNPSAPATREFRTILKINHVTKVITFTAGLTNSYSTGAIVTRPVALGTLRATGGAIAPFTQSSWLKIWSQTANGSSTTGRYNGAIGYNNAGTRTDRYAIVFTSGTQFVLHSERFGQIASGNTATDFSPLNPLTSQPLFTLYAAQWSAGWLPGNVLRFNTTAAAASIWIARTVMPSTAGGTDQATLFGYGEVNA